VDKNERFLRNYILTEGIVNIYFKNVAWHENPNRKNLQIMAMKNVDEEDSENEDKFDNFEQKFNFRFEEQGGMNITTHTRDLETYREKDDTRIVKRKEREQRIKNEKEEMKKEFKKAQEIKKSEILEKVLKLEKIAGTDKIKLLAEELDNEYNPDNFDKIMNKVFNEEFYNEKDKNAEDEKKSDFYTNAKVEFEEELDEDDELVKRNREDNENENNEENNEDYYEDDENKEYNEDEYEQEENNEENEWWYCDGKSIILKIHRLQKSYKRRQN